MSNKQSLHSSYYEIVKYNVKTRKDIKVLPKRYQQISEVNHKIDTLNAQIKATKKDEGGDIIYFRRKVHI